MNLVDQTIVLGSASPRRLSLLQQLGLQVEVCPADIDESVLGNETGKQYVTRLACEKSIAVATNAVDRIVIGADTTIEYDGKILGKPVDQNDCVEMLQMIQGRSHRVYTGVAATLHGRTESCVVETAVYLRALSTAEIVAYWTTGEPIGKAGSYAIQGLGAMFVSRIEGSYSNVVGLPLCETANLLSKFDLGIPDLLNASAKGQSSHGENN